ncbi:hypothetical protein DTI93_09180 [Parasaccharibacter sp. TMW 2.1884]|nr:hypothetical protein [Parasaccharibacter sp. TMW 2.1884]
MRTAYMRFAYNVMMFLAYMLMAHLLRLVELHFHFRMSDFLWACCYALMALPFILLERKYLPRKDRP